MSFKFQPGDYFKVKDPTLVDEKKGLIKSITFNSVHQDWEYVVNWDHLLGDHSYECVGAENMWEKITSVNSVQNLSSSMEEVSSRLTQSFDELSKNLPNNQECAHQWKLYHGFSDEYEYCVRCDLKRR